MLITAILGLFKIFAAILFVLTFKSKEDATLNMISRNEWNASRPNDSIYDLVLPLKRIIIAHTVTPECYTKQECIKKVQSIQAVHLGPGFKFSDIGYNFIIGGDGNVYEGRGWYKQGAHTAGYNRGSCGIAFIGNFVNKQPNDKQISAVHNLIAKGVELKVLEDDYIIYGASQLRNTESPGRAFMELIKTWPHAFN